MFKKIKRVIKSDKKMNITVVPVEKIAFVEK